MAIKSTTPERKRWRDRLMGVAQANPETWAVGFLDECWWSRVALPATSTWSEQGKPLRLIQHSVAKDDPEPKAVSCYGLYVPELDETWLSAIEPKWVHAKRKVVKPEGLLGAYELADRVCRVFSCPHYAHLSVPQKVA